MFAVDQVVGVIGGGTSDSRVGERRHSGKAARRTQASEKQEPGTLDRAAAISEPMPLFSEPEMGDFRSQWSKIQTGFVDEPRRTVEDADKLVAAVMQRLADGFANERSGLEKQ
jgi:hypothetical protein